MKIPETADLTRAQLVAIIAKLRSHIYSMKGHLEFAETELLEEEMAMALATSLFNISPADLINDNIAKLPLYFQDAEARAMIDLYSQKESKTKLRKKRKQGK